MSIELTMVATVQTEKQMEDLQKWILEIAISEQMDIRYSLEDTLLQVCPEGLVSLHPQGLEMTIASDASIAGPGYFAFLYEFYQEISKMEEVEFQIVEDYDYLESLDFENLKYSVFYPELQNYREMMIGYGAYALWNEESYMPVMRPGFVITPTGYIDMKEFLELDDEELAKKFFVWNDLEQDALYHKNAALALLCKKCYFEYSLMNEQSEKAAVQLLDHIDMAYDLDQSITLPASTYSFLSNVLGSEDISSKFKTMNEEDLGYLKEWVHIYYNNWQILIDGRCDRFIQKGISSLTLSAPFADEGEEWSWQWIVRRKADELAYEVFEENMKRDNPIETRLIESDIRYEVKAFDEGEFVHIMATVDEELDSLVIDIYVNYGQDINKHIDAILQISKLATTLS